MTGFIPPKDVLSNPPPQGLKYISICSGIEGATVAFHPLGWTPLAFAEIEAFPSALLAYHYPRVPNLGDMTKYREWPEEILIECELLIGGPPCQAFSVAGQRRSLDDERGNLTLTYVNLIDHIDSIRRKHGREPIIALYENVPGIYSTKDNAFGCLVGAICGQDVPIETQTGKWPTTGIFWGEKRRVGYRTLDAQYFGLAQRRRRCFVVAVPNQLVERLGDAACPSQILSIAESLRGDTSPRREAREISTSDVAPSLTGSGRGVERTGESRGQDPVVPCWWDGEQVSQTLDAVLSKGQTMPEKNRFPAVLQPVTHALRAEGFDASEDGTGRGIPLIPIAIQERAVCVNPHAGPDGAAFRTDGMAYTLEARSQTQAVAYEPYTLAIRGRNNESRFEYRQDGVANAILTPAGGRAGMGVGAVAFSCKDHGADAGEIAPTLRAMGHSQSHANAGGQVAVAFAENQRGEVLCKEIMDSLKVGGGKPGQGYPAVATAMQVRRLTPRECERLMGFPDDYSLVPYRGKSAADGNRYKALGNSFAVPVVRWIGYRLQMVCQLQPALARAA